MYAYIEGKIAQISEDKVIIDVSGIGYELHISGQTAIELKKRPDCRVWTHLYVKEDVLALFGFWSEIERTMFRHLISVSGIGPNTARTILSSMPPDHVRQSILQENVSAFSQVKGIGPKTAKRLILDLKDKMVKSFGHSDEIAVVVNNTLSDEALSALVALGFNKNRVQKLLIDIMGNNPKINEVEPLIKEALKQLS